MKFLADENFNNRIVRGLLRHQPDLDIIRVQDVEIAEADDLTVLRWAAQNGRILLTHDEKTIPNFAYEIMAAGNTFAGVVIASDNLAINAVIEDLLIIIECSTEDEWINQLHRLPL